MPGGSSTIGQGGPAAARFLRRLRFFDSVFFGWLDCGGGGLFAEQCGGRGQSKGSLRRFVGSREPFVSIVLTVIGRPRAQNECGAAYTIQRAGYLMQPIDGE